MLHRTTRLAIGLVLGLASLLCGTRCVQAQTLEIVASFNGDDGSPLGALVERADGSIYGTTDYGGAYGRGSIFVLRRGSNVTVETVHSFSWADGGHPSFSRLIDGGDGYLYGATSISLENFGGTVFRLDSSGRLTTIHDFDYANTSNPSEPIGPRNGFLYGTTFSGGANDVGTVYRIDSSGQLTMLHEFDGPQGARPAAGLFEASDGFFYGTTQLGGVDDQGTIFRIDPVGNFTLLHSFTGEEGAAPHAALIEGLDGLLYGTAYSGGLFGVGTVFKIDKAGNFTKLHDLDLASGDGGGPEASLVQVPGGAFYGTTSGTVFHVESDGTWSILHTFSAPDGEFARGPLLLASDGLLYGTTYSGLAPSLGSVFRVDTSGNFETLWTFVNLGPRTPRARLTLASDGKLWGTTESGGAPGDGTIFTLDAEGVLTSIHEFDPIAEALPPYSSLTEIAPGTLAGTSMGGGSFSEGTVYTTTLAGAFAILHDFSGPDGANPSGNLITVSGDVFGVTGTGGVGDLGTVFQIDTLGMVSTLHSFAGPDGSNPGTLIEGLDGNLYGSAGGGLGFGSLFRILLPSGDFSPLHLFDGADGSGPEGLIAEDDAGNLYGTTIAGGDMGFGTAFRWDLSGSLTTLHSFNGTDGYQPKGGLVRASDGNFYGTTESGGSDLRGTIFRVTPAGDFATVWNFSLSDTFHPSGGLSEGPDGNLYGICPFGRYLVGDLFRFVLAPTAPSVLAIQPSSGSAMGGGSAHVMGTHFSTVPAVTVGSIPARVTQGLDAQTANAIAPALSPGTLHDVTLTNPDALAATLSMGWLADFLDVSGADPFHDFVESIFRAGITAGYGNGYYGRNDPVTREQMAVFLLKAEHGSDYDPPDCTGVFTDVLCTPGVGFPDWIERLFAEGVTGGCIADPLQYCPTRAVTRAEMAVFLLKTKHGTGYTPPACAGLFADVPCPATPEFPFSDWIEQLYTGQVTGGCATDPLRYCPDNPNLRGEMAVFLTKTFGLP